MPPVRESCSLLYRRYFFQSECLLEKVEFLAFFLKNMFFIFEISGNCATLINSNYKLKS